MCRNELDQTLRRLEMYIKDAKLYFDDGTCLTDYKNPTEAKLEELNAKVDFLALILYNMLQSGGLR